MSSIYYIAILCVWPCVFVCIMLVTFGHYQHECHVLCCVCVSRVFCLSVLWVYECGALTTCFLANLLSLSSRLPRLRWSWWCRPATLLLLSLPTTCLPFSSFPHLPSQCRLSGLASTSHGLYTDSYIPFRVI